MYLHSNKKAAKEWGCGGRNFSAPDGSAPTKEQIYAEQTHCKFLYTNFPSASPNISPRKHLVRLISPQKSSAYVPSRLTLPP